MGQHDCAMAKLRLAAPVWAEVSARALAEAPLECCGLLAGTRAGGVLEAVAALPLVNQLASPTRFISEPAGLFKALRRAREMGLEVLAVYHSHPDGPPAPSATDLEWRWAPGVADLIVAVGGGAPLARAWDLHAAPPRELALEVGGPG
jgi:proteasome lid subunit RPN8/RPN11